jgi:hypothetical protein
MIVSLILFENEFLHIVSISFTALILNELIMVALEITTWCVSAFCSLIFIYDSKACIHGCLRGRYTLFLRHQHGLLTCLLRFVPPSDSSMITKTNIQTYLSLYLGRLRGKSL